VKLSTQRKIHVAVLYGGRSGEHEVSLQSAASVLRNLDPARFIAIPIAIDKDGRWHPGDISRIEKGARLLPVFRDQPQVVLPPNPPSSQGSMLIPVDSPTLVGMGLPLPTIDVVFPVLHGTFCEDGTLQGLLELADVPYVGCGVLASAIGMDKEVAKRLAGLAGIPVVPYLTVHGRSYAAQAAQLPIEVERTLGFPCFVKPSGSGSSVGVHKVKRPSDLDAAVRDALRFDRKVLIEKAIDAREIEVAVLESLDPTGEPQCSIPGEINPRHEFYSYQAKYLDENGAELLVPATLSSEQVSEVRKWAGLAFSTLECEGMARVDFFLDRKSGQFYFNEVNTIPGFTSISMYPKLWEASGLPYQTLLSNLIDLALRRAGEKQALIHDFQSI
jgi:D-alanine-D-alanine ligase